MHTLTLPHKGLGVSGTEAA